MTLSKEAKSRLGDIVELQPTKNSELQDRWGLESGSEVHRYLEDELKEYYYRDEKSLIRATDNAVSVVDVEPGIEGGVDKPTVIRIPSLQKQILEVLDEPEDRGQSVVAVLKALRTEFDIDPEVDTIRSALQSLRRKGVVEVSYRAVPIFKLAQPRGSVRIELVENDRRDRSNETSPPRE